ncbi:MAG: hypothetical protein C4551_05310 [Bacillota bacterium]|nr:MAG: hypothetical protein C4551_05310 [Bacillota bacterium]
MIRQGHIGRSQAILLVWYVLATKVFLNVPSSLLSEAFSAAWLVTLGGGVVAFLGLVPAVTLMRRFEDMPLARVLDEAGGLVLGKIASLGASVTLLAILGVALREFGESVTISTLSRTPMNIIMVTFVALVGYSAYSGIESSGRLTTFLTPFLLILFGLILFSDISDLNLRQIFPLLGPGPGRLAVSMLTRSSIYAEVMVMLILYPYLRERRDALAVATWALALGVAVLTTTEVIISSAFGIEGSERLLFPFLQLARLSTLGRFVTRLDPLFVFLSFFAAALSFSTVLWAAVTHLAEALRLKDHRPLIAPISAVVVAGGLLPRCLLNVIDISFGVIYMWAWIPLVLLPGLFLPLAVLRGKKGTATAGPGGGRR